MEHYQQILVTLSESAMKSRLNARLVRHLEKKEDNQLHALRVHHCIEGKRNRGRQAKTCTENKSEHSKTKQLNIRTAIDLARDRTRWRILVQTHRQPIADGRQIKEDCCRRRPSTTLVHDLRVLTGHPLLLGQVLVQSAFLAGHRRVCSE